MSSVLLTVALPLPSDAGRLPLSAGVTVASAVRPACPGIGLKWPNDLVVVVRGELRKLGGMIVERVDDVALIGIGLNVALADGELPTPQAVSIAQLGAGVEREALLARILSGFDGWRPPDIADYRKSCVTLGARVRVDLTDGGVVLGTAVGIHDNGALIVDLGGSHMEIVAGDVQHVRTA